MARDYKAEEINRKHWDEVAPVHGRSYDTEVLINGGHHLDRTQVEELGDLKGKKILHLQCHIGTDTLSLARLGAEVTGIDISGESLKVAEELSKEAGLRARFIQTPLFDLPDKLSETFDMVYTSIGVLCWISDLSQWARIINRYLKPGGTLYLMESHPFMHVFDDETTGLNVRYPYFSQGKPTDWPGDWPDYSDENYVVKSPTREFSWTLGQIHNSLTDAGLKIEFIHEFDFLHWKGLESMKKCDDGFWRLPEPLNKIPILFSLKAMTPLAKGES
ncbi:MAG: class I SAM-dependent methyltransferase [Candidatus Fermentibacteria bacterium]|nr:class I SAM-dependent methyltransferase [Candidatus Fermentibacteria bacterium]